MLKAEVEYFRNLDGLRFFCFLAVFSVHSLNTDNQEIRSNLLYNFFVSGLLRNGGLGVNFFFVLSGFLITYLLILEKQTTGSINIFHFWFKRIIRIWPLYFVCVLFGFVLFPFLKSQFGEFETESADLKFYLMFLSNFDVIKNGWPDSTELGVLWSISIEEQFYLVWPILLYLFPVKKYYIIFFIVIILSLIFRFNNNSDLLFHYHTLSCISDMAVGGFGAWLILTVKFRKFIVNLSRFSIVFIYLAFILSFVFKQELLDSIHLVRVFERLIISILILFIILEQNYSRNSFYKMGDYRIISRLGLTTFGNYMLHIIALLVVYTLFKLFRISENIYTLIIIIPSLSLILTIIFGKISFEYFEKPFLRLRRILR